MRSKKSVEDIEQRRQALEEIITKSKLKGKHLTRYDLIAALKKKGFTTDIATLYRDRTALNRSNSFIRDLSESNYSAYMDEIKEVLDWAEEEAMKQYKRKWKNNKTVRKEVPRKDGVVEIVEETITGELAAPKAAFLKIISEVQDLKNKLFHGDNIQLSVALLKDKLRKLESENAQLKKEKEEKAGAVQNTIRTT